jgi:hypothetical protein
MSAIDYFRQLSECILDSYSSDSDSDSAMNFSSAKSRPAPKPKAAAVKKAPIKSTNGASVKTITKTAKKQTTNVMHATKKKQPAKSAPKPTSVSATTKISKSEKKRQLAETLDNLQKWMEKQQQQQQQPASAPQMMDQQLSHTVPL